MSGEILVVGSLAYDSITTPEGSVARTLGGSANYFSLAASHYAPVRVVGVVGSDYSDTDLELLKSRNVDVSGLQKKSGKTFFWEGRYEEDMNEARTLATELNVFEDFSPELPTPYRNTPFVFLANIDPVLQMQVLSQIEKPKLVGSDTMNFWIETKKTELEKVLHEVDVVLINEGEAKMLSREPNAIAASEEIMKMGPKAVVVKRGEYGFVLRTQDGFFILPAFPIARVVDPTGAGDSFAGAFFGFLAQQNQSFQLETLKRACVHGCLMASFTVQDFGLGRLRSLTKTDFEERYHQFQKIISH